MTTYVGEEHSEFPFSSVAYIVATFPNGKSYRGSGAFVGENDVLTASHVVFSEADGGLAENVRIYPGLDGSNIPIGPYAGDYVNYFEADHNNDGLMTREESQYDLAMIGFETAYGEDTGWFGLEQSHSSGNVNLTGYPGQFDDSTGPRMTNDYGYVNANSLAHVLDYSSVEAFPGHSGGPLWSESDNGPSLAGVVSTGSWAAGVAGQYSTVTDWIEGNDFLIGDNVSPICIDDAATTVSGQEILIDVLANDRDDNGDSLAIDTIGDPSHGIAKITESDKIVFSPDAGFVGKDTFTYSVQDGNGGSDQGRVAVNVDEAEMTYMDQQYAKALAEYCNEIGYDFGRVKAGGWDAKNISEPLDTLGLTFREHLIRFGDRPKIVDNLFELVEFEDAYLQGLTAYVKDIGYEYNGISADEWTCAKLKATIENSFGMTIQKHFQNHARKPAILDKVNEVNDLEEQPAHDLMFADSEGLMRWPAQATSSRESVQKDFTIDINLNSMPVQRFGTFEKVDALMGVATHQLDAGDWFAL